MGGPAAGERTRPRVPCVDDGPVAGAPIGGMGAGTMGRTYRGDFARWHMRVGGHTHRPAAHTLFAARVDGTATVLSALPSHAVMEGVPGGGGSDRTHSRRVLPPDGTGGTYHALYPRSWYEYDPSALAPGGRVRLSQTHSRRSSRRVRDAPMPVGVFRFLASNEGDVPADVALAFSFENVLATTDVAPVDVGPPRGAWRLAPHELTHSTFERSGGRVAGVHMHTDDVVYGTRSPSEPWHGGIAVAVGGNGELGGLNVTTLPLYDAGDADSIESKFWRPFEQKGGFGRDESAAANEHDGGLPAGPLSACAVSAAFTLAPGERRNVTFAAAWDLPASSFPRAFGGRRGTPDTTDRSFTAGTCRAVPPHRTSRRRRCSARTSGKVTSRGGSGGSFSPPRRRTPTWTTRPAGGEGATRAGSAIGRRCAVPRGSSARCLTSCTTWWTVARCGADR